MLSRNVARLSVTAKPHFHELMEVGLYGNVYVAMATVHIKNP